MILLHAIPFSKIAHLWEFKKKILLKPEEQQNKFMYMYIIYRLKSDTSARIEQICIIHTFMSNLISLLNR